MTVCLLTEIRSVDSNGVALDSPRLQEDRVRQSVVSILKSSAVCSLATITPEGRSYINAVYFSFSLEYELFFLSNSNSIHCRNLATNKSAAVNVFPTSPAWGNPIVGVQLFGTAEEADGAAAQTGEKSYGIRFPDFPKWKEAASKTDLLRQFKFYRFQVDSLKIVDENNIGDSVWICASVLRR